MNVLKLPKLTKARCTNKKTGLGKGILGKLLHEV